MKTISVKQNIVFLLIMTLFIYGAACSDSGGSSKGKTSVLSDDSSITDPGTDPETPPDETTAPAITEYNFSADNNISLSGIYSADINDTAISVTLPESADLSSLIANFVFTGVSVEVNGAEQSSGETANNFTGALQYDVTGDDDSVVSYTVSVALDTAPVITMPDNATLTADAVIGIDATDDTGLVDDAVLINGELYTVPADYVIDIEIIPEGEFTLVVEATDLFGQTATESRTFIIDRQSILDDTMTIGDAATVEGPAQDGASWTGTAGMSVSEDESGNSVLTASEKSSLLLTGTSPESYIFEADVKLISGSGYAVVLRASDSGTAYPDGYAFVFDPGLINPDSGLRLSYFPLDVDIAAIASFTGIEAITGWHRIRYVAVTDPDDGLTRLEAYIGQYADPTEGTGNINYDMIFSVKINSITPHNNKPWNRINSTDLVTGTGFNSAWNGMIDVLYGSGSIGLALPAADSQIVVRNITVSAISQ